MSTLHRKIKAVLITAVAVAIAQAAPQLVDAIREVYPDSPATTVLLDLLPFVVGWATRAGNLVGEEPSDDEE